MKIRKATIADIPSIQRLNQELDNHHAELIPTVFRTITENARPDSIIHDWIEKSDADCIVSEVDGQIIGFLNIRKAAHPEYPMFQRHEFAMIENAVVEISKRGKGIGTHLFDAAIEWALDKNLGYVQTTVWSANKSARDFYVRQGFNPMTEKLELNLKTETQNRYEPSTAY